MNTNQIAKEIIIEKVEEKINNYSLLMKVSEVMKVLEVDDEGQIYRMLNKNQIPGAQKIPGMGWRINRDVFFTWLYSGDVKESKPFKDIRRCR